MLHFRDLGDGTPVLPNFLFLGLHFHRKLLCSRAYFEDSVSGKNQVL